MLANPEVVRDIERRLRELNPVVPKSKYAKYDSEKRNHKNYYIRHPDKIKKTREKYMASEHAKALAGVRRTKRRALRLGCEGSHTAQEWLDKKAQYGFRCAYCHRKLKRLTKDHIVPLSKNGTNYIYNIVPACKRCNSSKSAKDILAWEKFNGLQLVMSLN